MKNCFCNSGNPFLGCCEPFLTGIKKPPTAEALMRSRYSAYVLANANYLIDTTHISTRKAHSKAAILEWAKSNQWLNLEIIKA